MHMNAMLSLPTGEKETPGQYTHKFQEELQFPNEMACVSLKRKIRQSKLCNRATYGESMKVKETRNQSSMDQK